MTTDHSFQVTANQQGSDFEKYTALWLRFNGWAVHGAHTKRHGSTVDIEAFDPDGVLHLIECKGSDGTSKRLPGLSDGTTVKVCIGVAYYLASMGVEHPYTVFTSHVPNPGTLPEKMLDRALIDGVIDSVKAI